MAGEEKNQREKSQEKLMGSGGLTGEVSQLINKYAGGRIPILVDEKVTKRGLVDAELLKIYQKGFGGANLIPLGILLAKTDCRDKTLKWEKGCADYHLNEWSRDNWTEICRTIRACKEGDEECERCDREHAKLAEQEGDVIAYMCMHGMIDFAMPIFVDGEVIAVIFTGQRIPKENSRWNKEFVEEDGVFRLEKCNKFGVDARQVTIERFKLSEQNCDFELGTLAKRLQADVAASEGVEVTLVDVERIQNTLKEAGQHLSNLAESTYRLEKSKAVAALRSEIARSVGYVKVGIEHVAETLPSVVEGISKAAGLICKYFGIDYMLVLNIKVEKATFRILLEHIPEQMPWKRGAWAEELDEENFSKLEKELSVLTRLDDTDLWPLRKLPFFDWMVTWLKGKQASPCVAARFDRPGLSPCVLIAGRRTGFRLSDFRAQDKDDFCRVIEDIRMVMNVFLFIDELHAVEEAQELFLEDVAHDIRNPIQNLLVKIERLKSGLVESEELLDEVGRLGAQVHRIHRLSERVWVLEQIREQRLELDKTGRVNVYEVIREAIDMVKDVAEDKNVHIYVAPGMEKWHSIQIDRNLFFQAMLNLVDNAVKYSSRGTEVRIDGDMQLYPKCRISVVNRGVEIKEQYRDKIFERGFRTPEAKMHIWQGSGIGLGIVKGFADFHKGDIEFNCSPVPGTPDFTTEFRLIFTGAIL